MPRSSHAQALLGPDLYQRVRETPVLVVGAGGIGCELLKNLVLVGFANIEMIDLDTIDLSNLNRQFLFRKPDISKPKALVAAASARHFNPSSGIEIHARHGNVKEASNDLEWMKGFGLVMNALDNMDARRHVNRLCQAANVPLIESGTSGYLGQVTPMMKDRTECYDCVAKPTPKSFPVCTIRATPSEPIHCIVWAKSYLFNKLFGEDDEVTDTEELEKAQADGENVQEIANLKKEAAAFREVRHDLGEEDGPRRVFEKVFDADINRLLAMEDMWKVRGRVRPVPLDYGSIMDGTFVAPPLRSGASQVNGSSSRENGHQPSNGHANGDASGSTTPLPTGQANGNHRILKDQKELSPKETLELFMDSCKRLSARSIAHPEIILSFDKDDDDTLDFVLATANIRAIAYGIAKKTRFQVKEMAGNIIPAIATTNAIIAGLVVMQAMNLLSHNTSATKNVFLKAEPSKPLGTYLPAPPDPKCAVCRDVYIPFKVNLAKCTLGEFVLDVVGKWLKEGLKGDVNGHGDAEMDEDDDEFETSILEGGRVLADPDFDDNHDRTLADLGVERGKMLTVLDEAEKYRPFHFCICEPDPEASRSYVLPTEPPVIPHRPAKPPSRASESPEPEIIDSLASPPPAPAAMPISSQPTAKRRAADDGDVSLGNDAAKRRKVPVIIDDDEDDIQLVE